MLKLYHAPRSTSARILWLLEELRDSGPVDIEVVRVRDPYTAGGAADPANPHPHGFTPALLHDGQLISETGAVALYLTDLFPQSPVGVAVGDPQRGAYLSWVFYQVGLTEPLVYMKAKKTLDADPAMRTLDAAMMKHIEHRLADEGPYLLGARFTAADILMMSLFEQARPLLGDSVVIDAYLKLADRPARRRAQAID